MNLLNWRRDSRKPYTEDQREKRKELGEHIDKVGELCREALGLANGGHMLNEGIRSELWTEYNALMVLRRTLLVPNERHLSVLIDAILGVMNWAVDVESDLQFVVPADERAKLVEGAMTNYQNALRRALRTTSSMNRHLDRMTQGKRFSAYPLKSRFTLPRAAEK
ncbi:hypothetical protein H7J06_22145 [Mycobacterium hodleri]|uniref:hypothetical protein n=1 Tax=Mycolicibacterium hodleri TaxID=49897 RepID=UPI0021F28565|nr:hypothetical protein [Mycolicibacterium hodleri]MCV7135680.1 hypothetical protein [Mycolicibacterium hodleri]